MLGCVCVCVCVCVRERERERERERDVTLLSICLWIELTSEVKNSTGAEQMPLLQLNQTP